jgi:predicted site-specific integrase-resolvase
MDKYLSIGQAAPIIGVSITTLRRWELEGKLVPERTKGNQRRYKLSQLRPHLVRLDDSIKKTVSYARVSSHDQKSDLERQKQLLELYCASQGWQFEIISDLGSGMNYHKKGLKKLLSLILDGSIGRLVLTHKDRLLRFGAELVFALCAEREIEIVIINKGDEPSFEEELAKDVLEIITVFSARLYGSRSRKNKKLLEGLKEAYDAAGT